MGFRSGWECKFILALALLVFGAATASADELGGRHGNPYGSRSGPKSSFRLKQSGGAVRNLCAQLLTKPELAQWVDVEGAPGLRILSTEIEGAAPDYDTLLHLSTDAFHPHELVSSARYAKIINTQSGETLLMVPGIEHKNIPGFDGVIFNAKGEPVANYSLKTVLTATADHSPIERAKRGVDQAKRFSSVEDWLLLVRLLYEDESGQMRLSNDLSPGKERETKDWLAKSLQLFGVKEPTAPKRPSRVVVDIQSEVDLPDEGDLDKARRWVAESKGLIESIVFIKGDRVVEIK